VSSTLFLGVWHVCLYFCSLFLLVIQYQQDFSLEFQHLPLFCVYCLVFLLSIFESHFRFDSRKKENFTYSTDFFAKSVHSLLLVQLCDFQLIQKFLSSDSFIFIQTKLLPRFFSFEVVKENIRVDFWIILLQWMHILSELHARLFSIYCFKSIQYQ